ncbi:head-tail connector protein [Aeoliella sp.]|uniref:head-tail connector protein n=1 Tax=Aeoliella sp. TaxID=2795800 RepID=UPI003CCB924E
MIDLDDLKEHLNIDLDTDDDRLTALIDQATDWIETQTNQKYTASTYLYWLPCFPSGFITLPKSPLQSVTIDYYDSDNVLQELTDFFVRYQSHVPLAGPNIQWPQTYTNRVDAVKITMVCGVDSDDIPPAIKQACLQLCTIWNEQREGNVSEIKQIDRIIAAYRRGLIV